LLLVGLLLGCGVVLSSTALAAPGRSTERVVLEIGSCDQASADEIRRIVGIEIGDLLVAGDEAAPAVANRLQIRCSGDTGMLGVTNQADARPLDRKVLLDDFPHDAVPRVLALAGIETLAALSPAVQERLAAQRSPELSVRPAVLPMEPTPRDPSGEKRALRGRIAGMARAFSVAHGALSWGGRMDVEQELDRSWQLVFGLDLAGTRASTANLGQARALLYSGCALLGLHTSHPSVGGSFDVGIRMGGVHFSGDAGGRIQRGCPQRLPSLGRTGGCRRCLRLGRGGAHRALGRGGALVVHFTGLGRR
jgi:hypothetical protein